MKLVQSDYFEKSIFIIDRKCDFSSSPTKKEEEGGQRIDPRPHNL
jgi:hypothetical protein